MNERSDLDGVQPPQVKTSGPGKRSDNLADAWSVLAFLCFVLVPILLVGIVINMDEGNESAAASCFFAAIRAFLLAFAALTAARFCRWLRQHN